MFSDILLLLTTWLKASVFQEWFQSIAGVLIKQLGYKGKFAATYSQMEDSILAE